MRGFKALLTAGAVALLATSAHAVNLVADGDFNAPSGGGGFITYGPGAMGPWTVTQGSVDLIGGYWQAPTVGGGSVDLDGLYQEGGLSQLLTLGAGLYKLSFYLSGNPDANLGLKKVDVSVGDASQTFSFNTLTAGNSHGAMGYIFETLMFNATGPTTLRFTSNGGNPGSAFGPVIGGVSVSSAVPEPATWALMISGFGMAGVALRRRRVAAVV